MNHSLCLIWYVKPLGFTDSQTCKTIATRFFPTHSRNLTFISRFWLPITSLFKFSLRLSKLIIRQIYVVVYRLYMKS